VALIDSNEIQLEGFYHTLGSATDLSVVCHSTSASEVIERAVELEVQVVVAAIESDDLDITQTAALIGRTAPDVRLVTYGAFDPGPLIKPLLRIGISTYFIKDQISPEELYALITEVHHHNLYYTSIVTCEVVASLWAISGEAALPDFSEREQEVVQLISMGMNRKAIACELFISEATVKYHMQHIYEKAEVNTTQELLITAFNSGWIERIKWNRILHSFENGYDSKTGS